MYDSHPDLEQLLKYVQVLAICTTLLCERGNILVYNRHLFNVFALHYIDAVTRHVDMLSKESKLLPLYFILFVIKQDVAWASRVENSVLPVLVV